jgi:hypothetical protein
MSRFLVSTVLLIAAATSQAALLPETIGKLQRGAVSTPPLPSLKEDKSLLEEYGFESAERAAYGAGNDALLVTAYRFKDPTGALSGYQWFRAKTGKLEQYGNYLLRIEGPKLDEKTLLHFQVNLPRVDHSSLPDLKDYLPSAGLVPNSERYILGPASLNRFEPRIPPSLAAFHVGAEAQLGTYKTKNGDSNLLIFSYPTPQIARQRLDEFAKVPEVLAKRAGPLVAVIVSPADRDDAERLLAQVKYQPTVTWNQATKPKPQGNAGEMLLAICTLAGILGGASILFGFAFGGFKVLRRRFGLKDADYSLTALDLSKK